MPGIIKDFASNIDDNASLLAQTLTADGTSSSIDMQQYRNCAMLFVIGNSGDTLSGSVFMELEIQVSDDNSTFTAAPDVDVKNTVTGTNTGTVALINAPTEDSLTVWGEYTGSSRYVRAVVNLTGTHSNGTPVSVVGFRTNPNELPV